MKSFFFLLIAMLTISCNKDWLDVKSNKNLAVPNSVADLQALLDAEPLMNSRTSGLQGLSESGTDNFYYTLATWQSLATTWPIEKNAYIFAKTIFEGDRREWHWNNAYQRIYYANVVLDNVDHVSGDELARSNTKGHALFIRAYMFSQLAEVFALPYNRTNATTDLGIPLRLHSDPNEVSTRATVQQTFDQIVSDLNTAIPLLPPTTPYKTRPSRATAHSLLSRVYLVLKAYDSVLIHANASLSLTNYLLDYNDLKATTTYPVPALNNEILFQDINASGTFATSKAQVDTLLYRSYQDFDLRKTIFFKKQAAGYYSFNGHYSGASSLWGGIATDEVVLNKAEAAARTGKTADAIDALNSLLKKRWTKDHFTPVSATSPAEALQLIITERRKELCFRGLRWMDLRRLNQEDNFKTTITHVLDGTTYTLPPNSPLYTYPIPVEVIQATGMTQNNR